VQVAVVALKGDNRARNRSPAIKKPPRRVAF
jgi:hypothetical protein